jgi:hypothetical protein
MWYAPSSSTTAVPWLAQSFSVASNGLSATVNLQHGVHFADNDLLNSSAVYFSLNRLLILDGSTPNSHGSQASWILQQLLDKSLSTFFSGPQPYSAGWVKQVLEENFVEITGPFTFTLHIQHPTAALTNLFAGEWSAIVDPMYVMPKEVSLWNYQHYTLPYYPLSGSEMQMMTEYFYDEAATCNVGITPNGCGATYLDSPTGGSRAGTGPYLLQSFNPSTDDLVLAANPHYWGGPLALVKQQIQTVDINYVPAEAQRVSDLKVAAGSGFAMYVDVQNPPDVIDQNAWLNNNQFVSSISGVTLYGPFIPSYFTTFDPFVTNVTNPNTNTYYKFQPFADFRWRLAFADAVNLAQINLQYNDKLALVAQNAIPPGLPPSGAYNPSIAPVYTYDLNSVTNQLSAACMAPITSFTDVNGNPLSAGTIDNSCADANASKATINLVSGTGDSADAAIMAKIATNVQNALNNLGYGGITVTATQIGLTTLEGQAFSHHLYFYSLGWLEDYPWVLDFLTPIYGPGSVYPQADGWNTNAMRTLENQAVSADASGNIPALIAASNAMNTLANKQIMYLWTFYPEGFWAITSNVHGVFENPSLSGLYFATLT